MTDTQRDTRIKVTQAEFDAAYMNVLRRLEVETTGRPMTPEQRATATREIRIQLSKELVVVEQ